MIPYRVSHLDLPDYEFPVGTNVKLIGWSNTTLYTIEYLPGEIEIWSNCYSVLPQPVFSGIFCIASKKKGARVSAVSNPSIR